MIKCLQLYLSKGLVACEFVNLPKRQLAQATCYEFIEWCGLTPNALGTDKLIPNIKIVCSELYYDFTDTYPDFGPKSKNTVSRQKFHRWLELYGEYKYFAKPLMDRKREGNVIVFKTKHDNEVQTEVPF